MVRKYPVLLVYTDVPCVAYRFENAYVGAQVEIVPAADVIAINAAIAVARAPLDVGCLLWHWPLLLPPPLVLAGFLLPLLLACCLLLLSLAALKN